MDAITTRLATALAAVMECSKDDRWNGSFALDEALQASREALRDYADAAMVDATTAAPIAGHPRSIMQHLSDALSELLGDVEGLADEYEICREISESSYGNNARAALERYEKAK